MVRSSLDFFCNLFEELSEMGLLVLKEFDFLFSLLSLNILSLSISLFNGLDFGLEFTDLVLKLSLFVFQLLYGPLEICLSVLSLELLPHGECN